MPQQRTGRSGGWSHLPADLLQLIADRLTDIADLFRFRSVCASWRSVAIAAPILPPQLPWLLLPSNPYADPDEPRHFFSLSANRVSPLRLPSRSLTIGSPDGLVLLLSSARSVSLLNPLTRTQIHLPTLTQSNIRRAKLLRNGNDQNNFLLMVCFWFSSKLGFWWSGDTKWRYVAAGTVRSLDGDFTFYDGRFYVIRSDGAVSVISPTAPRKEAWAIPSPPLEVVRFFRRYLVEPSSSAGLLLVTTPSRFGERFEVFQLDRTVEEKPEWVEVRSIGDCLLFLDNEHAVCFDAGCFDGLRANCIYFTGVCRICLYDIGDGRVEQLPCYWENFPYPIELQNAAWFVPALC